MDENRFNIALGWRRRGEALVKLAAFVTIFVMANLALNFVLSGVQHRFHTLAVHVFIAMISLGIAVVILIAAMASVLGEPLSMYGYSKTLSWQNFSVGLACGVTSLTLQLLFMTLFGVLSWSTTMYSGSLFLAGLFYAVLFLVIGFTEESLFRGYALVQLSQAIAFWPAALVLAVLFGAAHGMKGGGEDFIGGLQAAAVAVVTLPRTFIQ